jgi:hypothetical protein
VACVRIFRYTRTVQKQLEGSGTGVSPKVKTQGHLIKTGSCESCLQLGNQYTRTIPPEFAKFD